MYINTKFIIKILYYNQTWTEINRELGASYKIVYIYCELRVFEPFIL